MIARARIEPLLAAAAALVALAAGAGASGCIIRFFPLPTFCDETPVIPGDGEPITGETRGTSSRTGPVPMVGGTGCMGGMPSPEDVYTLELSERSSVHLDTLGSGFDTIIYVRDDCESIDPAAQVACNDDAILNGAPQLFSSIDVSLDRGTYFVFVDGFNGDRGDYVLNAVIGPPDRPPGDQCATAVTSTGGDIDTSTTTFVDDTAASCGGEGAPDAYFTLTLIEEFDVTIETVAAGFDTVLSLRASCLEPESEIACDDGGSPAGGGASLLALGTLAAGSYVIIVDGAAAGESGAYTLRVTLQ